MRLLKVLKVHARKARIFLRVAWWFARIESFHWECWWCPWMPNDWLGETAPLSSADDIPVLLDV
jgi:hypothetical protein